MMKFLLIFYGVKFCKLDQLYENFKFNYYINKTFFWIKTYYSVIFY